MAATSSQISRLVAELNELRDACLAMEKEFESQIAEAPAQSRRSVQNFVHYLALRRHDLRDLQSRLAALGLLPPGRSESNVMPAIEAVISILEALAGCETPRTTASNALKTGPATLAKNADDLLGAAPKGRAVRIMVTMPGEAAHAYELVKSLVENGMDVMRINCAHDGESAWEAMIGHLRRANEETGRQCRVQMDLAGPTLRTGPIHRGYHVARWRVERDKRGGVITPAQIGLVTKQGKAAGDVTLPVPESLVRQAGLGDIVRIIDSRGKKRDLEVINRSDDACLCTCEQSGWVLSGAAWSLRRGGNEIAAGHIGDLPFVEEPLRLRPRDLLVVTKAENRAPAPHGDLPHISCTLPEVFAAAKAGQPIFFDDGKIEGRICDVHSEHMLVEILYTGGREAKLGSARGINLPETEPGVRALTDRDRRDLDFIVKHADIIGLSCVRSPEDVFDLQDELAARGQRKIGIAIKIETRAAFDQLATIMIAAMRHHPVGIMAVRGDLAIETGFERLAEIQEEILGLSEAAHIPVVWATQVLQTPARAECVMLNKRAQIVEALEFLDNVLHKTQAHHAKKRSMLRRLSATPVDPPIPVVR